VILCEGAHDQATIVGLCETCAGWNRRKGKPDALPQQLEKIFPNPKRDRLGAWEFEYWPTCLQRNEDWLVIRNLGGVDAVLGSKAALLLQQIQPDAVGIIVDADDQPTEQRVQLFKQYYVTVYGHADSVEAGQISSEDEPRLGLWICPNNAEHGTMAGAARQQIEATKPDLSSAAAGFVNTTRELGWPEASRRETKMLLGALHQVVSPGGSLATGLFEGKCWLGSVSDLVKDMKGLADFIEALVAA